MFITFHAIIYESQAFCVNKCGPKTDFDMNQPLQVIYFAINYRPTRGSIPPYNIAGLILKVSEEVANRNRRKLQYHRL